MKTLRRVWAVYEADGLVTRSVCGRQERRRRRSGAWRVWGWLMERLVRWLMRRDVTFFLLTVVAIAVLTFAGF